MDLLCRTLVNCAGLSAVDLAKRVRGLDTSSVPEAFFAKGNYFRYAGTSMYRIFLCSGTSTVPYVYILCVFRYE